MNHVIASEFASDEDLRRFREAKARGKTDEEAFAIGDNGIGCWGDPTNTTEPLCALPPETMLATWGGVRIARGQRLLVTYHPSELTIIVRVADRMPHLAHITNGARIDLNPAACRALKIPSGAMVPVSWIKHPA